MKKLVKGNLLDITLFPSINFERTRDANSKRKRDFALALCLFAKYLFVYHQGFVDLGVIDVVVQAYGRKVDLIPLILGEALLGLDEFSLSRDQPFASSHVSLRTLSWSRSRLQ